MFTIHLHNLRFFAYHGIHEEERVLGNEYILDIDIAYDIIGTVTSLEQTIDYSRVYALAQEIMNIPTPLLETVVQAMAARIRQEFPGLKSITIRLIKLHPPIRAIEGQTGVSYSENF